MQPDQIPGWESHQPYTDAKGTWCQSDDMAWPCEVSSAFAAGVAAGRKQAALPEDLRGDGPCGDCGTLDNIVWFTEPVFWNDVVRQPNDSQDAILCIPCFVKRTDALGLYPTGWRLIPDFHWETKTERAARIAEGGEPNA